MTYVFALDLICNLECRIIFGTLGTLLTGDSGEAVMPFGQYWTGVPWTHPGFLITPYHPQLLHIIVSYSTLSHYIKIVSLLYSIVHNREYGPIHTTDFTFIGFGRRLAKFNGANLHPGYLMWFPHQEYLFHSKIPGRIPGF